MRATDAIRRNAGNRPAKALAWVWGVAPWRGDPTASLLPRLPHSPAPAVHPAVMQQLAAQSRSTDGPQRWLVCVPAHKPPVYLRPCFAAAVSGEQPKPGGGEDPGRGVGGSCISPHAYLKVVPHHDANMQAQDCQALQLLCSFASNITVND